MNKSKVIAFFAVLSVMLSACSASQPAPEKDAENTPDYSDAVRISLGDGEIKVDGEIAGTDSSAAVYTANDIVYYEEGKDFTYGEGTESDAHSENEAKEHTVIHISQPGTYSISGSLQKGQIAVDLGDEAKEDPEAVVTLVLNGVDLTCDVAPAIIFYNVYECSEADADSATKDVDTEKAGANIIIADGTENIVNGSYVARIYKPDSVVLSEDETEVEDAKKLHKYDGAVYSKMSMNVFGGEENTGTLEINAKNEGLDTELHLTINGGNININSGNDGINTNEDGVSVTTINGGELNIKVSGETGEGDGIDSNGWLVINGGKITAQACSHSEDAGIDSDMGIHINGGEVVATGHMLDRIEDGGQTYAVFSFAQKQVDGQTLSLKDENGNAVAEFAAENEYSVLIYSSPSLTAGVYTLWSGETQLAAQSGGMFGGPGMMGKPGEMPEGMEPPEMPEGVERPEMPEGMERPERPEGMEMPEMPEGTEMPERPEGMERPGGRWDKDFENGENMQELSAEFNISDGGNMFQRVSPAEQQI